MVSKVLCLALLACTLIQAAPQGDLQEVPQEAPKPSKSAASDILHKAGDAGFAVVDENVQSIKDTFDAKVDAAEEGWKAGVEATKTGLNTLLSGPRFGIKLWNKSKDDDNQGDFFANASDAAREVIDENAEKRKKNLDTLVGAGKTALQAGAQLGQTLWDVGTSPFRAGQNFFNSLRNKEA